MSTNPAVEPKVRKFESVEEGGADLKSVSKTDGICFCLLLLSFKSLVDFEMVMVCFVLYMQVVSDSVSFPITY